MSVLRTLVFGALVGVVGKKLYENGSLDRFAEDVKTRYGDAKDKFEEIRSERTDGTPGKTGRKPASPRLAGAPSPVTPDTVARTN